MIVTILKALATAGFIVLLSEIARRSTLLAAVMIGLPLATILTVAFTAGDKDVATANQFATSTFYLVWPGLAFFIVLPLAQRLGAPFWVAFALAVFATGVATWGFILAYKSLGIKL
ncbi:MAG: hypothetical protein SGJ21_11725 [Alphaproteobacteria bacterium]|nr:hypothetical protein [Alphaproteobacteria bacterium]